MQIKRILSPDSPYKRQARLLAMLWTLLIFIGCFTPGKDIPKVDVPLIDKWVHLVLFGGFTFLWLCTRPVTKFTWLVIMFLIAVALGSFIELMQGWLTFLGRSMELLDAVADSIGALLGIVIFAIAAAFANRKA